MEDMPSKEEIKVIEKSTVLDIILSIRESEKTQYTKDELIELLYEIALEKSRK